MKRIFSISMMFIILVTGCFLFSCHQKKDIVPSKDFAPYISAYTGGKISKEATIVIELAEKQLETDNKENLFSFSPSIKGTTRWVNSSTVEFVPEEGALKSGMLYNATFALEKVMKVDKKFSKFEFSFRVEENTFKVTTRPIEIRLDNTVNVYGSLSFSEKKSLSTVEKMIEATLGEVKIDDITVAGKDNSRSFEFLIQEIKRNEENQKLLITINGAPADIDSKETISVTIPAKDIFRLLEYEIVSTPEYGLRLTFSDLVSESQDLKSMITLKNIPTYTTQVQANQVMVYFAYEPKMKKLEVVIDQGLKNRMGDALEESREFTLSLERLKPQVEILSSGTIMPGSGKVILPFKAVALHAVDLKIIRIFESNVLMFLQSNKLSKYSSNQMRRSGRLVYRQTLRLDNDPTKDISVWENYSIDLSEVIKQQPGAIYRIELSFTKEYASYECENEEATASALRGASDLMNMYDEDWTATWGDDWSWDQPDYYYDGYEYEYEYEEQRYNNGWERGDPCNPSYYRRYIKSVTNVFASNLGLIAKSNSNNTVWATVTNLLDAKPVSGAKVTAYNYQLQPIGSGITDENGFTVLSLKNKPFVLVAEAGEHKAYLRMVDGEENMLSRFDVGGSSMNNGLKGYVYGERGVWRPGDTLHIAFMLEDRDGRIPANHPVSLDIFSSQGQFYKRMVSSNGLNGLYSFDVPTKADDPTGLWNSYVSVGGATFHKSLRIETIKPNRLKINLDIPPVLVASKGIASVGVHSQWLTGAVARNLDVKMEFTLNRLYPQFVGFDNFIFNNPASNFSSGKTDMYDGKLNDKGDATFDLKIPSAENAPGMLSANITCRVYEPGGDASIFSQSVTFSPYSSYVGISFNYKDDENNILVDEDRVFDIVTLSPEGKPINVNDLEYRIYRVGWNWWWQSGGSTFESYINNSNYKSEFSGKINTVNGKGQIKFRINYPDYGRFFVYVKDPSSGHATGGTVQVDWPTWRGRSNMDDPDGIKMLTFSFDKKSYNVGEDVVVTIPATASKGSALVALENGSEVLQREWVNLTAGDATKYTFKVTDKMSPNIYIHISLLQPHASTGDLPIRMYGVRPLFVSDKETILKPVITVPDVIKPETGFEIKVKEQSGKAMTYTLAIVDDGLLDLTNFKTPDPWNIFYAREALGIRTWDLFDEVMGAFAGKYGSLFTVGGDAELNKAPEKANRFKPVVLFVGPTAIKAGEEKIHSLRLPPYVGSVRVMVVAGQSGAYGRVDKTVTVRAPLMLLSSLPRVLSTNEKISLPVNVFAMENNVKNVTVKVETTGKLKATDGNSKSITFSSPGDEIVYFPMQTGAETGIEKVTITATSGGNTSRETIEIDVRNPNPPYIKLESTLVEKGQTVEFDYTLDDVQADDWVKAEMSRIPTVDLSRRYDFLYDYDHFCTEQLTSRALPLLYLSEFKELGEKEAERSKKNITEAINHLYNRQLPSGGFSYWPGQGSVNDWASSYAGSFLVLAKERGYNVNNSVINKWISYQRNASNNLKIINSNERYSYSQTDFMRAYRLYTLALAGAPEMGAMNRLKEVKDLTMQARWQLAAAYALCGKQDAAKDLVFNVPTLVGPYSSNNPTFGSSDRDESMILEALVLMGKNDEAFKQAQKVSQNLKNERSFSTQSTAYAMVAMGQFAAKVSGKFDFDWYFNGTKQSKVSVNKAVFQTQLPTSPSSGKVKVENGNEGVLYFSLATKNRPLTDTASAVFENIKIDVTYTDLYDKPISVTDLTQGTDFYANIKVSNISLGDNYSDVALTYIVPSGWEIYNKRMVAASMSGNDNMSERTVAFTYQDIRDDRVLTYFDLPYSSAGKTIKIRLQASYIGDFILPAVLCEAMYDTSACARTTAGRVKVSK